ncbi:MAG: efflux RND transporter permease subunit [Pseudomonadota bacterium]|jgi:multidrug efflux pump subunit AcrB|uniref:Cation/multidrug efflux pump n=1 Tax=Congregibacter litoralis KT71 TaxID=314285 RepID=A4A7S3_9GAMM|nr:MULTISPECIES: efflux RND transporter permease subunit [Halieaceae]EAQ97718.1 Cation/multidrug efflux pump [Congregibacter litoralis KT71]
MMGVNLSALAVRQRSVTRFFIILAALGGLSAFLSMGRAEDPAFVVRSLVVSVLWPGASAEEVDQQLVHRLEKRLQEVAYLYRLETVARPGRADITVEFEDFTPAEKIPELQYQVRKRMLDEMPLLPQGVVGPIVNDDYSDVFFSLLALTAPGLPLRDLTREVEAIRDRLRLVPGVHKALILGERPERIYVDVDNALLNNLGVSSQALIDAINTHVRLLPAGERQASGPLLRMRVGDNHAELDNLRSIPVRLGNHLMRLDQLAEVYAGYEDPPGYVVRAQGEDALLLGVVMTQGANGLDLGERLDTFLAEERERLPLGMSLLRHTNQAEAIADAVNLFQIKFLVAVLVVMLVSFAALGLRAGIVVGISIPLTLGITFLAMKLSGINLDRITLGALIIALGLLVDDAIIAIEIMLVKMEAGMPRVEAAAQAWHITAAPMLFGTLVTVSGFVPIGFARSSVGEYAGNIFWVLAYALIISWLVAVTFTPYLGVRLLREPGGTGHGGDPYDTPRYRRLRALVRACVSHRVLVVAGTVLLLVLAGVAMNGFVQKQFFPGSDRLEVIVSLWHPQGTSIAETGETVRAVEALLEAQPGVVNQVSYVGAGAPRFFISSNPEQPSPAFGKVVAVARDKRARDAIMAAVREQVTAGAFAQARVRVSRLLYGPPVVWPLAFRIVGPDPVVLRNIGRELVVLMNANPHIKDPHLEWDERIPIQRLIYDEHALARYGLTPASVARSLQVNLHGEAVGELRQGIRTVPIWLRGRDRGGLEPGDASRHELRAADGGKVSLAQIGRLAVEYEEPVIMRYNRERFLPVVANIRSGQPNSVTDEVWEAAAGLREELPPGYRIDIGGSVEKSGKANASLSALQPVMVALMLIFVMLQMRSFRGTFMVVATAPLGLIGAVAALLLFNQPFGFVALLGLIGLAGILMRNTLILAQQVEDNRADGMDGAEAVIEATVRRARPVILTALAAVFAFVPLTLDGFWGPMAYVLIGGLAVGTAITLLFVPALYALWYRLPPLAR